jgi:hypothetical protein
MISASGKQFREISAPFIFCIFTGLGEIAKTMTMR